MADHLINIFKSGTHNVLDGENIPTDASQDAKNWVTVDGRLKLAYGRALVGTEGAVGKLQGLWWAYKTNGDKILFRKIDTKLQYLAGETWTDVITGLTNNAEMSFANYSSLAGAFVYLSSSDGFWKINTDSPGSYVDLYDATENDKGKVMIDKGRLIMWDCVNASKTTLKLSWIDRQNSDVYTNVTGEAISNASPTITGTLAFKAGGAKRNMFGLVVTGTTGGTPEVLTDNKDGTLSSSKVGGSGTINYTTGAYSFTFSANATSITCAYLWEDSTEKGLADFTFSATRVASEGNRITQDIGGDKIQNVLVGQDGAYYSLKEHSAYRLEISADDATFTNLVYRRDIGISNWRSAVSTSKGIVFMNTANPDKPELTILQRNPLGDNIEPFILFPHFKFSNYTYEDCCVDTWERYIVVACSKDGSDSNDTVLLCDSVTNIVDITGYFARIFAKSEGVLYAGSPITLTTYKLFNGFDDNGLAIDNYWVGKDEQYKGVIGERLKKFKRLRFKGFIDVAQSVEVYISYDGGGFDLVGTIYGQASYVDFTNAQAVGSNMIGEIQIGGADTSTAYPFFAEMKIKTPKFRKRTIKLEAKNVGYVDIDMAMDWNIEVFESKIPKRHRLKQNVSLDGSYVNLAHPDSTVSAETIYILKQDGDLLLTQTSEFIKV